jgi:hypothetical protein
MLLLGSGGLALGYDQARATPTATVITLPTGERIAEASLAVADFNGDGYKEVVAGGQDGMLHVVSFNGSSWSRVWVRQTADDLNAAGAPNPTSTTEIHSSPAVADLDGDGKLEIVVTLGGDPAHHLNGGILVYTYNSPWSFSVKSGWPQPKLDIVGLGPGASDPDGYWDGIWGSPALGDVDGDGDLEIAVEGFDRRLHLYHHTGVVVDGWPITRDNGDALLRGGWSSPAIGDVDGDGEPEIVFGTDSPEWAGEGSAPDYTKGTLWALNADSSLVPGFPVTTEQWLQSSPALGDLDDDGLLDIVIGTGMPGVVGTGGYQVYAWHGDGTPLPNWPRPTAGNMMASPALGDVDGDGDLEVVIGCGPGVGTDCTWLYAWHGNGSSVAGFPMQPQGIFSLQPLNDLYFPPVIADYDGDGATEILVIVEGAGGVTIVTPNGLTDSDISHRTSSTLSAAPVVDDIDNDGKLETLVGGADVSGAHGEITIWDEVGSAASTLPWPTFHHDMQRTGSVWGADSTPPTNPTLTPIGHAVNAWSNDNTVQINLSGATDDESGVWRFYYAWDTSPGTDLDSAAAFVAASTTSLTSDALADGDAHYFHLRSLDHAGNWADTVHLGPFQIDTQPPASTASSPVFAAEGFQVVWSGSDAGSGLESYDVQVRQGTGGSWSTWQDDITSTQANYTGAPGNTYYFRSIARDVAGNTETPPSDGDTHTTVTTFAFTGHIFNNRGEPVFMAQVQATPAVVGATPSDLAGAYGVYFDLTGVYQLTIQRSGFGALPALSVTGGSVSGLDFYLPPAQDFVTDGGFELGGGAWEFQGVPIPTIAYTAHTGDQALWMQGQGMTVVSQTFTLPGDLADGSLTLSWMALVSGTVSASDVLTLTVTVDGQPTEETVVLAGLMADEWTHGFLSLSAQAGQQVVVRLVLDAATDVALYLDEISLGATRAGVERVYLPLVVR